MSRGSLWYLCKRAKVKPESGQIPKEILAGPVRNFYSEDHASALKVALAHPPKMGRPAGKKRAKKV